MNIVSLILALLAVAVFLGGARYRPWADYGLGLALLTSAWIVELLWVTANQLHVG